jgi:hypothetical protein
MMGVASLCGMMSFQAWGQSELYVSSATGSNRNDGSKEKPFKNIDKAISAAEDGATIYVAEGNYFGTLDKGNIIVDKPVKIIGGYSPDFATRDVLKFRTMVQPTPESNATAGTPQGTFSINCKKTGTEVTVDGLIFDRGNSISYSTTGEGKPEGVECPMMNEIGKSGIGGADLTTTGVLTKQTSTFYLDNPYCDIVIRNCAFLNSPYYGIIGSWGGKTLTIENCVFVGNRFAGADIKGSMAAFQGEVFFRNNTILFTWSRLKDFGDMGMGFYFRSGTIYRFNNNIVGLSVNAGLDRASSDSDKKKEDARITDVENNLFFLNKLGDLSVPGGGKNLFVKAEDFEEIEKLTKIDGNKRLTDPAAFKGRINEAYLNGFLAASYKEDATVDRDSDAAKFRAALGMNTQGTIKSAVTMFANRYPWEEALKLFGAIDGYGAQNIK